MEMDKCEWEEWRDVDYFGDGGDFVMDLIESNNDIWGLGGESVGDCG